MFLDCILDFYCTLYSNVMYGQGFSAYKFSSCHHLLPSFLFVSFLNWSSCIWITWRRSDRYRNTDRSFFYNLNVKLYQLFIWILIFMLYINFCKLIIIAFFFCMHRLVEFLEGVHLFCKVFVKKYVYLTLYLFQISCSTYDASDWTNWKYYYIQ